MAFESAFLDLHKSETYGGILATGVLRIYGMESVETSKMMYKEFWDLLAYQHFLELCGFA
jgi:hypothetical protein